LLDRNQTPLLRIANRLVKKNWSWLAIARAIKSKREELNKKRGPSESLPAFNPEKPLWTFT
jgi:hypothetical protein